MSTLEQLVKHWQELSNAASQLDLASTQLQDDQANTQSVSAELRSINSAINRTLAGLDMLIAEAVPSNLQDAAILAAFAWRAHNENDLLVTTAGELSGLRVFDDALSKALTNLVRYLSCTSNAEVLALMSTWCVPHSDKKCTMP